jgi:hypothetical protein
MEPDRFGLQAILLRLVLQFPLLRGLIEIESVLPADLLAIALHQGGDQAESLDERAQHSLDDRGVRFGELAAAVNAGETWAEVASGLGIHRPHRGSPARTLR